MQDFVESEFYGFNDGAIFALSNGEIWQQTHYQYHYHYAYRPEVKITSAGSRHTMDVPCMGQKVEVTQVTPAVRGKIVSQFSGFRQGAEFVFSNGQKWRQTQPTTITRTLIRPDAMVIDGANGKVLSVEGMSDVVRVARLA